MPSLLRQPFPELPRRCRLAGALQAEQQMTDAGVWSSLQGAFGVPEEGTASPARLPDVKRPAAIAQLNVVGEKAQIRVYDPPGQMDPSRAPKGALAEAGNLGFDTLIIDSAGRLHIDDELMGELVAIRDVDGRVRQALRRRRDDRAGRDQERRRIQPARGRHGRRADEDGRRRARRRGTLGGVGRRRPDRVCGKRRTSRRSRAVSPRTRRVAGARYGRRAVAHREAEAAIDIEDAEKLEAKIRSNEFTLEDFRDQLKAIRRMGPLEHIIGMLPGMGTSRSWRARTG